MLFSAPLALVAAAAAVSASPVASGAKSIQVPVTQHSNVKTMKKLVERGQARIANINNEGKTGVTNGVTSGTVTNEDVSYVASVSIGGKAWSLIVDTGCKYPARTSFHAGH